MTAKTNKTRPHPSIIDSYVRSYAEYGPTPLALGWTKDKQGIRYKALLQNVHNNQSLLDYGCGLAHMRAWMRMHQMKSVYYCGVDVVGRFIENAHFSEDEKRATIRRIYSAEDITREYDHVVMCGVFNRRGTTSENLQREHAFSTIRTMLTRARKALHVDFLRADTSDVREPGLTYFRPESVLRVLRESVPGSRFMLDCSYMPYEFSVHIYKNDAIETPRNIYQESL